jgi:cysteinyl-tRNA synthetase
MGMTDVDDKIIKRSAERGISPVELARFYEEDFFRDMRTLNVRSPTLCTRVTEHIPDIMQYIGQIMENGYGYRVADGSVYFDVQQLGPVYGKLKKGENDTTNDNDDEPHPLKKDRRDFALWKGTLPSSPSGSSDAQPSTAHSTELSWKSPWSESGRPGWHIECSAMSGRYLGTQMDVHWGGIDLAFPHHNNEIAQADAFTSCGSNHKVSQNGHPEWVRYFLHSGHLHIEGKKMSKSLKNFVTIKEFLSGNQGTADELRLLCLNAGYHSNMDFTAARIHESRQQIERFKECLTRIMKIQKNLHFAPAHWNHSDHALFSKFEDTKARYDASLCNNFDTREAIQSLLELVRITNAHCDSVRTQPLCAFQLEGIAKFLLKSLKIFGLSFPDQMVENSLNSSSAPGHTALDDYMPLLSTLVSFRNNMRAELLKSLPTTTDKETLKVLLKITDDLRDTVLPDLGIMVKDIHNAEPDVRIIPKDEVQRMKNQENETSSPSSSPSSSSSSKLDFKSKTTETLFKDPTKYSQYDEHHIPTHDQEGQVLSKSARKKLQKEMDKFVKWQSQQ